MMKAVDLTERILDKINDMDKRITTLCIDLAELKSDFKNHVESKSGSSIFTKKTAVALGTFVTVLVGVISSVV